jgi:hypothetical protein
LWNSTPAWGQPFIGSPALQSPATITQIEAPLAQTVAGLSAYAFADESFYGEFGVYRSALQGASVANSGNVNNNVTNGVAPYWRFAYEYDWGANSWEFGTLGLFTELANPITPAGNAINFSLHNAETDRFLDAGLDSQYEYIDDDDQVSVDARWIHEDQHLDASYEQHFASNQSDELDSLNLTSSYFWRRKFGGTLGFFNLSGSQDPLYYGNFKGNSNSNWGMAELDYLPWLNIKLGLQYTAFLKFNGASSDYDGAGRSASDNNLLYLYLWLAF